MAIEIFLRCITHDPHVDSATVGYSSADLPRIQQDLIDGKKFLEARSFFDAVDLFVEDTRNNQFGFLIKHQDCELEVWETQQAYSRLPGFGTGPVNPVIHANARVFRDVPLALCGHAKSGESVIAGVNETRLVSCGDCLDVIITGGSRR